MSETSTHNPVFQAAPMYRGGRLPWESAELLGPKPPVGEYGYMRADMPHPCSLEELRHRVQHGWGKIPAVWTPDSPMLVPAVEAPALFEAARARLISRMKWAAARSMMLATLVSAGLYFGAMQDGMKLEDIGSLIVMLFIFWGVVPTNQAIRSIAVLRRFTPRDIFAQGRPARYDIWIKRKRLIGTWLIGLCIAAVAVAQIRFGWDETAKFAGLIKPLPVGQWWRLLSYSLLHGSYVHIGVNLFALIILGRWTEVHARTAYLPLVFLIGAIGAGAASLYMSPAGQVSVGASGGLMGLIGFLAVMGYRRRSLLPDGFFGTMVANVLLISVTGFAGRAMIDNAAHFGGFAAGAIVGLISFARPASTQKNPIVTFGGMISALILIILSVWTTRLLWIEGALEQRIAAIPQQREVLPGLLDATEQFQAVYTIPDAFKVEGAKIDTRNANGMGIVTMRGRFLKPGVYGFVFEERDAAHEVFQDRVVRVRVEPKGSQKVIMIGPEEGTWETYPDGLAFSTAGALAIIEWPDDTTNSVTHWQLKEVGYTSPAVAGK